MMNRVNTGYKNILQLWLWLVINCIGWLFVGALLSLAASVVIVAIQGPVLGLSTLQNLIQQNEQYLSLIASFNSIRIVSQYLHELNTSLMPLTIEFPSSLTRFLTEFHSIKWIMLPYIHAIFLGLNLLVIRLYLLFRWCPLFLMFGLVGLVDGLAQRHIRRVSAGRESALVYHQSKSFMLFSLIFGLVMSLVLPINVSHSAWVILLSAMLFGITTQMTAKSFKKYL